MKNDTELASIKGVGSKTAEKLAAAGLVTAGDLINFLPRTYEDFSKVVKISELTPGKVTIKARCESISTRIVRRGLRITTAVLADDSSRCQAVWFNQPYRETQLKPSLRRRQSSTQTGAKGASEFFFSGEFAFRAGRYQLTNPSAEAVKDLPVQTGRVLPIYPARKGLKPNVTRKILNELRPLITMTAETLPAEILKQEKLVSRAEALTGLHFPESAGEAEAARKRLAFEELFGLILAARLNKQENSRLRGFDIPFDQSKIKEFVAQLPFDLTDAQRRALWEILQNFANFASSVLANAAGAAGTVPAKTLAKTAPMNRLLQGDVGSGKTVVAGAAAYQASLAGYQTAFMAPTEILATQHAETLRKLLEPYGVKVALLTGSVKGKKRAELLKQIASGAAQVVVGTHALFQPAVRFLKLGFAIIDEQHRFGVKQRQALLAKGANFASSVLANREVAKTNNFMPHLLAMTATPIPRSLQLTLFGDLDISILDQLPKGRRPIATEIVSPNSRAQMNAKIAAELAKGHQVYFIAPLIEESIAGTVPAKEMDTITAGTVLAKENVENLAKKVAQTFARTELAKKAGAILARTELAIKIGILHGRQTSEQKEKIMREFVAGKTQILVATTVIEVGVDVPNASVMVIENADQFGLAQLHQLRGRVGRGEHQSFCFLVQSDSNPPTRRLREIERSSDGFYLAEVDLKLRGAGEIYGTAQHGDLNLQIANLADTKLIKRAAGAATTFAAQIAENPKTLLKYPELAREVAKYQRLTTLN
ncbi:ATP-dependent DNA helicase RecG [Candidatus Saccharibacteria bacterium]|nr:ATP-dependent DNA helicase RecG [Candidatus Saccharibacteria bacterium]